MHNTLDLSLWQSSPLPSTSAKPGSSAPVEAAPLPSDVSPNRVRRATDELAGELQDREGRGRRGLPVPARGCQQSGAWGVGAAAGRDARGRDRAQDGRVLL